MFMGLAFFGLTLLIPHLLLKSVIQPLLAQNGEPMLLSWWGWWSRYFSMAISCRSPSLNGRPPSINTLLIYWKSCSSSSKVNERLWPPLFSFSISSYPASSLSRAALDLRVSYSIPNLIDTLLIAPCSRFFFSVSSVASTSPQLHFACPYFLYGRRVCVNADFLAIMMVVWFDLDWFCLVWLYLVWYVWFGFWLFAWSLLRKTHQIKKHEFARDPCISGLINNELSSTNNRTQPRYTLCLLLLVLDSLFACWLVHVASWPLLGFLVGVCVMICAMWIQQTCVSLSFSCWIVGLLIEHVQSKAREFDTILAFFHEPFFIEFCVETKLKSDNCR